MKSAEQLLQEIEDCNAVLKELKRELEFLGSPLDPITVREDLQELDQAYSKLSSRLIKLETFAHLVNVVLARQAGIPMPDEMIPL